MTGTLAVSLDEHKNTNDDSHMQTFWEKEKPNSGDTPQGQGGDEGADTPKGQRGKEDQVQSWDEFTKSTTFHGIKYIFDRNAPFKSRRLLWFAIVVGSISVFISQVAMRADTYFEYHTNVDVQVRFNKTLTFPCITICNHNKFRLTAAVDHGMFDIIDKIYSGEKVKADFLDAKQFQGQDVEQFYLHHAHLLEDFIESCTWRGAPCNISEDFDLTWTDMGLCFTFNTSKGDKVKTVNQAGAGYGLTLVLNIEQYEYMKGPNTDAGVKVLLHDWREVPSMQDLGFAIAPGTHTLAAIDMYRVKNLERPYGMCNMTETRSMSDCLLDCKTDHFVDQCGCRDIYMPNNTAGLCDLKTQLTCISKEEADWIQMDNPCNCSIPCERVHYEHRLSYAHLSRFNLNKLALGDTQRKNYVRQRFLRARDISQRAVEENNATDTEYFTRISETIRHVNQTLKNAIDGFGNKTAFALTLGTPDILGQWKRNYYYSFRRYRSRVSSMINKWQKLTSQRDLFYFKTYLNYFIGPYYGGKIELPSFFNWLEACADNLTEELLQDDGKAKAWTIIDYIRYQQAPGYGVDSLGYRLSGLDGSGNTLCDKQYLQMKLYILERLLKYGPRAQRQLAKFDKEFTSFIKDLYENTTKARDDNQYNSCLVNGTIQSQKALPVVFNLTTALEEYKEANRTNVYAMLEALKNVFEVANYHGLRDANFLSSNAIVSACPPYSNVLSSSVKEDNPNFFSEVNTALGDLYSKSNNDLDEYVAKISVMYDIFNKKLWKLGSMATSYLASTANKRQMLRVFASVEIRRKIEDVIDKRDEVEEIMSDIIELLNNIEEGISRLSAAVNQADIPMMKHSVLMQLPLMRDILKLQGISTETMYGLMKNGTVSVAFEMMVNAVRAYREPLVTTRATIREGLNNLTDDISVIQESLEEFVATCKIGPNFYLENFLKVDVFYKELKYEQIDQRPSFELLSLLSEVGGFLGLLLGASVLTVCELLDYACLQCLRRFYHRNKGGHKTG